MNGEILETLIALNIAMKALTMLADQEFLDTQPRRQVLDMKKAVVAQLNEVSDKLELMSQQHKAGGLQ